jgi:hypothetical protein
MRNYPAEVIKELEELLQSGVACAQADPKRKDFYDLKNLVRTFFHISPKNCQSDTDREWAHIVPVSDSRRGLNG